MKSDEKVKLPVSNAPLPRRQRATVRERVIHRFQKLGPIAVIAAAPVLNTACDPAPEPYCTEGDPADWVANITAEAVWIDDGMGGLQIQLTIQSEDAYAYLTTNYTATGATVASSNQGETGQVLVLIPDSGVTEAKVAGELSCDGYPGPFTVTLTWTGTPAVGDTVTTSIASTS